MAKVRKLQSCDSFMPGTYFFISPSPLALTLGIYLIYYLLNIALQMFS